jgi:hypothetical protein
MATPPDPPFYAVREVFEGSDVVRIWQGKPAEIRPGSGLFEEWAWPSGERFKGAPKRIAECVAEIPYSLMAVQFEPGRLIPFSAIIMDFKK